MAATYTGFSSYQFQENKQFKQTDLELVKTDLIAHIFTSKGSRVMMPEFGTLIPDVLFEPLDDITTELIEDELRSVFDFDPRVILTDFDMTVDADRSFVQATVVLFYVELNRTDVLDLNLQFET